MELAAALHYSWDARPNVTYEAPRGQRMASSGMWPTPQSEVAGPQGVAVTVGWRLGSRRGGGGWRQREEAEYEPLAGTRQHCGMRGVAGQATSPARGGKGRKEAAENLLLSFACSYPRCSHLEIWTLFLWPWFLQLLFGGDQVLLEDINIEM